jgi:putative nucleotidyltransferase with HDIG domain
MPRRPAPAQLNPGGPPPRLLIYVRVIVALGAAALLHSVFASIHTPQPVVWLLFGALTVVTGSLTTKMASVPVTMSVSDTFFFASAMLFGGGPATILVAITSVTVSWRRRHSWQRFAFNAAAPGLSMWVGTQAFFYLAGVPPLAQGHQPVQIVIVPLLCLTAVYFLLNTGLTATAVALDTGTSPLIIWRRHFLWLSLSFLAAASVAFCLILVIQQVSVVAAAMVSPLLIIFHMTLRSSWGRLEDAQHHLASMDRLYLSTIETLAMAIDAKDDVTHSHVRRVQAYAVALAEAMGITDEESIKAIKAAALLHDTGKLAVPEHILNKPGKLTPSEFDQMKLHVDVGADILSLVDFPYPVVPIVRGHHENWDGSGYPRGTSGEDIPIGARILSVVDCYDALTSDRPYRAALSDEAALDILRQRRGTMYDPRVVDAFIAIHRNVEVMADAPNQRDVLQKITQSRGASAPAARPEPAASSMSGDVLAFVSLARLASGEITLADVFALASKLMRDVAPGVSAAWYLHETASDALVVMEAFGPAADILRGTRINVCERVSGWVAANRQVAVNSDAALDLGSRAKAATPSLESCLSAPLTIGDSLIGVLTLYAPGCQAFTEDHGRLVQMIAPHLAQAISRAKQRQAGDVTIDAIPAAQSARDLRLVSSR